MSDTDLLSQGYGFSGDNPLPLDAIVPAGELPDGSSVFEIATHQQAPLEPKPSDFYENIASKIEGARLEKMAQQLLDDIKQDIESRKEWETTITLVMKFLGIKIQEYRNVPFMMACASIDSSLLSALIRSYSDIKAECFPARGPVKDEVVGIPMPETEDKGERVKLFMNHYLTNMDEDYYSDSDRLVMILVFFGSAFRKVYQDPIKKRPLARFISPQDLIINQNTTSVLSSDRITHRMQLTRKEVLLQERSGDFLPSKLPEVSEQDIDETSPIKKFVDAVDGIKQDATENKSLFVYYESHVNLDPNEIEKKGRKSLRDGIPKPYIVTICTDTKKIVSIKRNWEEHDTETYERIESFVGYKYLPGFGMYGWGLAHVMGSNAITLTSILRQQIDAGTLKNFPGGLRKKGLKLENNDKAIGPSEFLEVETGEMPLQDCIMLMPYGEPSVVLFELMKFLKEQSEGLGAISNAKIPEANTQASTATTLALLEHNAKEQSNIILSFHNSLKKEFKLLFNLFGKYLPEEPYPFAVPGMESAIMKSDFDDRINIVPVSDPNLLTSTHRIIRAETILNIARGNPELHDMRELYHRVYQTLNVPDVDKILPPEQEVMPLDPITENMNIMNGKPVKAGIYQDHDAHDIVHDPLIEQLKAQGNEQAAAVAVSHKHEHQAFRYLIQMQMSMGMQMPNEQDLQNLEIQNEIAIKAAEVIQQQQKAAAEQQAQQLDPNAVMMADIEQRREASYLKNEESKLRSETDAYKAQLSFESEKAKISSSEAIAEDKNEVAMAIAEMKESNKIP